MRAFLGWVLAFGVGCASSKFDVAESPLADTASGEVANETGAPDTLSADDTSTPPSDAVEEVAFDASGPPCTTIDDCTPGDYCARPSCGVTEGRCQPFVTLNTYSPVCSCDGITYWNRSYANISDAIVAHIGRCTAVEAKTCLGADCALPDSPCVHEEATAACVSTTMRGVCWKIPSGATCGGTPGMSVSLCGGGCLSYCAAVLKKQPFYQTSCTF